MNDRDTNAWRSGGSGGGAEFNRSLLEAIQEASPDGLLVVDENAAVVTYNRRFLEIWRIPHERVKPDEAMDGAIPDYPILMTVMQRVKDPDSFIRNVRRLYDNPSVSEHTEIELKDGRVIERDSTGLIGEDGAYLGRVWFFRDITEHKRTEAMLRHLASHDPLTGLLNRRNFYDRAAEELTRAARHQRDLALLMLDLDHFKSINDHHGHAAGDRILEQICSRCVDSLRTEDIFARIGGEEFALLMPDTDRQSAAAVAERLRRMVAEDAVDFEGKAIYCTVSVGVTMIRPDESRVDDALSRADEALYRAKSRGRNRVECSP